MGYRSEVAFTLTVDGYFDGDKGKAKFKAMLGFFKLSEFYRLATDSHYDCIKGGELGWSVNEGRIAFNVQDWKWYEGFPIVDAFDELWRNMSKLDGISGYFMRSGEDIGDVHEQDFGEEPDWDFAHVCKHMEVNTNVLGETESEEGTDEQVQTDTHPCGQDADQERQDANTAAVG